MSAWLVSKGHIDALVWAFIEHAPGAIDTSLITGRDQLGQLLMDECLKSVSYRYPGETPESRPGSAQDYLAPYSYTLPARLPSLIETFKNLACYEYQSCEHPAWEISQVRGLALALTAEICKHLGMTEEAVYDSREWEKAPWGWDERRRH